MYSFDQTKHALLIVSICEYMFSCGKNGLNYSENIVLSKSFNDFFL